MVATAPPDRRGSTARRGFDEIQAIELERMFGRIVRMRLAMAPMAGLLAVSAALLDPAPWRVWSVSLITIALVTLSVVEFVRMRRDGLRPHTLALNLVSMGAIFLSVIVVTGGVESPFVPAVLPVALIGSMAIGLRWPLAVLVGLQLLVIWTLTVGAIQGWLPAVNLAIYGGGARAGHNDAHLISSALVLTWGILVVVVAGQRLRGAFDAMLLSALDARDDELVAHAEHVRDLSALTGEIAHELKNPLASVKGLASLLAADVDGRAAERLAVLRAEADRMQGILEEFLNFSRPLVPLSLVDVDLGALAAEVAVLHEGVAGEAGVSVVVDVQEPRFARCDPRKVRQMWINLVQNALDASASGQTVTLRVAGDATEVVLEVLDEGPGLPEALGVRVLEAGVTSKARGSGLGLPIVRALARQHGGDLTLLPRSSGGLCARLAWPRDVVVQTRGDA